LLLSLTLKPIPTKLAYHLHNPVEPSESMYCLNKQCTNKGIPVSSSHSASGDWNTDEEG
jgi:hypothetical protein